MKSRSSIVLAAAVGLAVSPVACAGSPPVVQQEINHLIAYIGNSGCDFKRNGAWNDAKAAQTHVRSKYDFLEKFGLINTTYDFIDKAATKSNLSGQPYEIKCGAELPIASSIWLGNELARYRASRQRLN